MERLTRYTDYEILLEKGLDILVEEPEDFDNLQHVLSVLAAYEDTGLTPEQIMELKKQIPPCKVGDTVYIITKCKNIPAQLDGTMYGPDGGFGTATGYYCPYENSNGCPFEGECNEFNMKEAVFEDTVDCICIEEDGMCFACENTTGFTLSDIGKTAFSSRAEAEAKLAEMEGK